MNFNIILILFFVTSNISASELRGNGADAVICYDKQGQPISAEVLDLYEGRVYRNINSKLGDLNGNFESKIDELLQRLSNLSPFRAKKYRKRINHFLSSFRKMKNIELTDISDSPEIGMPKNCKIEQVALKSEDHDSYILDEDIWESFDDNNKAAFLLHLAIFEEAQNQGQTNSVKSRYFNSHLASLDFEKMSLKDFVWLLFRSGLRSIKYNAFLLKIHDESSRYPGIEFDDKDENLVKEAYLLEGKVIFKDVETWSARVQRIYFHENSKTPTNLEVDEDKLTKVPQWENPIKASAISFFPSGKVLEVQFDNDSDELIKVGKHKVSSNNIAVQFNENGQLKSVGRNSQYSSYLFFIGKNKYELKGMSYFHDNGYVESIRLAKEGVFFIKNKPYRFMRDLEFHKNGHISEGSLSEPQWFSIQKRQVLVDGDGFMDDVKFFDSGTLKEADILNNVKLKHQNGHLIDIQEGSTVVFDVNGLVKKIRE